MCAEGCVPCAQLEAVRQKACVPKQRYGARAAREVADARNRGSDVVYQAYRCPFADDDHWHVGHRLSWSAVERLAALLRHRQYPDQHPKEHVA